MIKLIDILFENCTKKEYIDSIKKCLSDYAPICSCDNDSDFLTIKVKRIKTDEPIGEFKRFVTNSTLHKTEIEPVELKSIVEKHDFEFAKKHNLRIKGQQ